MVKNISLQDLLKFFHTNIKNKCTRAKISIRQYNMEKWKQRQPIVETSEIIPIENPYHFKIGMELWPSFPKANL
jgi:hypothetical protein